MTHRAEGAPKTDWNPLLRGEFDEAYFKELTAFVACQRQEGTVYPPEGQVFAALHETSYADMCVVVLGQDPYHGPGQAHGLSFSVPSGVVIPPSLRNIYKELHSDLGIGPAPHGDLSRWAKQGVLLLNSVLTVSAGCAGSHRKRGWETFTDRAITVAAEKATPVVFILWGNYARSKKALIDAAQAGSERHLIIESPHPSPLSASRGFFGSKPFSKTNDFLVANSMSPIDWNLV